MKRDPIVEEVHRIREKMWDECGGDLDQLIESFRASEAQRRDQVVSKNELARREKKTATDIHASPGR